MGADLTYSQYKRAKPTQTDPEDDTNRNERRPIFAGGIHVQDLQSKNGWTILEACRQWSGMDAVIFVINTLVGARREKFYSSVAGDTFEASTAMHNLGSAMHNLGSINESDV